VIDTDPDSPDTGIYVGQALHSRHAVRHVQTTPGEGGEARVAVRFEADGHLFVVALRKQLDDVVAAVNAVKTAVIRAALVGLAVAVLLGVGLASATLRRLRRLHDVAVHFGEPGERQVLVDNRRDEVGDLARAFAEMQARVNRQEELRRAFVATASHELRTPLMSVAGMLELLEEDLSRNPPNLDDARRQLAGAREQSERMTRLAADLLDISRLDAELALRREPVELGEVSRAVIAELDGRTRERGAPVVVEAPGPLWALADPTATARILRILLDNALRYTPPGEQVHVSMNGDDAHAAITVRDSGPGVPESDRERIFERFTRGTGSTQEGGFGLGLAIGRELATKMGGSLTLAEVTSGAAFRLVLPAQNGERGS
jgi:signal transduction histidine kinase